MPCFNNNLMLLGSTEATMVNMTMVLPGNLFPDLNNIDPIYIYATNFTGGMIEQTTLPQQVYYNLNPVYVPENTTAYYYVIPS
jgi:hypothetical protein